MWVKHLLGRHELALNPLHTCKTGCLQSQHAYGETGGGGRKRSSQSFLGQLAWTLQSKQQDGGKRTPGLFSDFHTQALAYSHPHSQECAGIIHGAYINTQRYNKK